VDQQHTYALAVVLVATMLTIALAIAAAIRAHLHRRAVFALIRQDLTSHARLHQPRPAVPSPGTPDGPQPAASARATRPPTGQVRRAVGLTASSTHVSPTATTAVA
jgi:hypothetical protein